MRWIESAEFEQVVGFADWLRGTDAENGSLAEPKSDPIQELERERQQVLETASERGYLDGMRRAAEAIADAETETRDRIASENGAQALQLSSERDRLAKLAAALPVALAAQESKILDAAIEIALVSLSQLFGQHHGDAALLPSICRQALEECRHRPVTIRVAPVNIDQVRSICESDDIRVVADTGVAIGDCELHSMRGIYATGLDRRLSGLRDALMPKSFFASAQGDL